VVDPRLADPAWGEGPLGAYRRTRVLVLVVVNVAAAVWYFSWLLDPARVGDRILYALLLCAELFNLAQATGFWWSVSRQRHRHPVHEIPAGTRVDVFVPRYDEPEQIVAPVLAAARRLRGADVNVVLLDDGNSPQMAELAARLDVGYLAREGNSGAKAGNINHGLRRTDAPFVAVFDCDHVPHPDFLVETLGVLLADPKVAFAQTPQHYANAETNEVAGAAWAQQALFFGCIARGKDARGAMFCCGTNVTFRRSALMDEGPPPNGADRRSRRRVSATVGADTMGLGFPEDSVTEDFQLGLRLHEAGWRSVYLPVVLAQGLGPEDTAAYIGQQLRWARGCLSAIPATLRARLPLRTKAQYLLSSMYFLTGWTVLVYMALPVIRIFTGRQPLAAANADQFLVHFAPYFALALTTVAVAGAGRYTFRAFALAASTFWVHLVATCAVLLRRNGRFVVTPKTAAARRQPRAVWPTLVTMAVLAGAVGYGLTRSRGPAMLNNVAFASVHLVILAIGVSAAFHVARRTEPEAADVDDELRALELGALEPDAARPSGQRSA
jgi:cellulose synthase (UDP-forming)